MKKPNVYSHKCDIYPIQLDVIFDIDCIEYLNSTYGWVENPEASFVKEDTDAYGLTYDLLYNKNTNKRTVLVVFDGIPKPAQMAHESFHIMNAVMKEVGLDIDLGRHAGNEHLAYIIEWAVECICESIDKEKKCKKKKK